MIALKIDAEGKIKKPSRVYERDTDEMFLRLLRSRSDIVAVFAEKAIGRRISILLEVKSQVRHAAGTGSIDIVLLFHGGPVVLVENKIDAAYSITREGHGQPQRYRASVATYRSVDHEACSVLLAPARYLASSRLADLFDARISYEDLRDLLSDEDRTLLEAAIKQAQSPYEPAANTYSGEFFAATRQLVVEHFPDLVMKRNPNPDGIRPNDSRTVYFDVPLTLRRHSDVVRPRMSLQCWDSANPSASVKIMLPGCAGKADRMDLPQDLADIGGYLRPAGRSLGIVIDTPRLDTQRPFAEQADDVVEALEAAIRLQGWWNTHAEILRRWTSV